MADPFSIGGGIVGILGLIIQISQVVGRFGLKWKDAPKVVQAFNTELRSLQVTLSEMTKLVSDPSFEEAFEGNSSAILSHLKAEDTSKDVIKGAFENCEMQLIDVVKSLEAKGEGHRLGWQRLKAAFLSEKTESAISQLQRQCRILDKLVAIDTAQITASTNLEIKQVRKEHQQWHTEEESRRILRWLSQLDFEEKHRDILSKLHPGTGQWLLDLDEFQAWRNGLLDSSPTLWCPGIRESIHT
jgi:hypothetical protein